MVDKLLLDILVCPWCLGKLRHQAERLSCIKCHAGYKMQDGIPNMLVAEADLECPACTVTLEKRSVLAVCKSCGRRFKMDARVQGTLLEHAKRCCPCCDPEEVELKAGENDYVCPRCGAHFHFESKQEPTTSSQ